MTSFWTVYAVDVECGAAAGVHLIPAGDPVRVISSAIRRCQAHSSLPVDWEAVDAAAHVIDASRAAGEIPPAPLVPKRMRLPRPVRDSREVAVVGVDPKQAAAGRDD